MIFKKEDYNRYARIFLARQFLSALLICIGATFLFPDKIASWVIGALAALSDSCIMMAGIRRGLNKAPEKGLAVMRINMVVRILSLSLVLLVMLKLGLQGLSLFVCFLLLHIVFLVSVIIIANRKNIGA